MAFLKLGETPLLQRVPWLVFYDLTKKYCATERTINHTLLEKSFYFSLYVSRWIYYVSIIFIFYCLLIVIYHLSFHLSFLSFFFCLVFVSFLLFSFFRSFHLSFQLNESMYNHLFILNIIYLSII